MGGGELSPLPNEHDDEKSALVERRRRRIYLHFASAACHTLLRDLAATIPPLKGAARRRRFLLSRIGSIETSGSGPPP